MNKKTQKRPSLSPLENAVMKVIWNCKQATAEEVRERLQDSHCLKTSTVRTVLSRLEEKRYLTHDVQGRTYVYHSLVKPRTLAVTAVRSIVEKFCAGSVEDLLVGLVDDKQISTDRLRDLISQIESAESGKPQHKSTRRRRG